eukprot:CAMPEP_0173149678 /NCGR_PEP_ID=MMETSP1105-20130129/10475_1 /TAXON_ID=2985 /ORGANISM="Ochromonas sp., Strain BG-1" /LENGTH=126 /DNA_ID=CAMNT_0014064603 /DNA_START=73 /DNA_END=453 /DNA_ORIENTATION=+
MTNISCIPLHDPTVIVLNYHVQTFQDASEASDKVVKLPSLAVAIPKNNTSSTQSTFTVAAASVTPLTNSETVVGTADIDLESGELNNTSNIDSYERQRKIVCWVIIVTFFVLGAIGVLVAFVISVP